MSSTATTTSLPSFPRSQAPMAFMPRRRWQIIPLQTVNEDGIVWTGWDGCGLQPHFVGLVLKQHDLH